jgi:hypothetical protein
MSLGCVADVLLDSAVSIVRTEVRRKRKFLGLCMQVVTQIYGRGRGAVAGLGQWEQ